MTEDPNNPPKETTRLNIPEITLEESLEAEVDIFYHSLHNQYRPWQRKLILSFRDFRPLKESLEAMPAKDEAEEKRILSEFLKQCRDRNKDQIEPFISRSRQEVSNKSGEALKELAQLMDYNWPENFPGYKVVPVLLPFNPFGKNIFYYSILKITQGVDQKDLLEVAIHEISHMVFFEILERLRLSSNNFSGPKNIPIDYLKEILAPVLMNQPPLRRLLDLSRYPEGYTGNPDLGPMFVTVGNSGERTQISRYFQQLYERMRYQEHKTFPEIVGAMVKIIMPLEAELLKRRDLWNEYQHKIFKNQALLDRHSEPMRITEL